MESQTSMLDSVSSINDDIKLHLAVTGKWCRFLGILGYIFTGFIVLGILMLFFASSALGNSFNGMIGIPVAAIAALYLGFAVLNFFLAHALYKFGVTARSACLFDDEASFVESHIWLKKYFRIVGILAAIVVIIYGIVFLVSIFVAMAR
ncbi:MAG: hypothetical protein RL660_2238 [Bacteroidota bacterium]|jgi:hypothetical protein